MPTSQGLKNVQTLRPFIDPASVQWGADPTGVADSTDAFNNAYTAARLNGYEVRPSPGTYKFNGSIDPAYTTTRGTGSTYTRETSNYTGKGVVFLHAGSDPLISPSAGGWTMDGVIFFDPLQTGSGATPVLTRPPLISAVAPYRLIDWTFTNCTVINCLDFLKVPEGSLAGDIRISGNKIYAIRYIFWFLDGAPESIFVSDNIFTAGIYADAAIVNNGAMLAKWTEANGSAWAIDLTGATQWLSIDGIKSTNNLFFGYYACFNVVRGRIDVSVSSGDTYDGINRLVSVTGQGSLTALCIENTQVFSRSVRLGATVRTKIVELNTSSDVYLKISGRLQASDGDVIIDEGSGVTTFQFSGYIGPLGLAVVGSTCYAFRTDNPTGNYQFVGVTFSNRGGVNLDAIGLNPVDCEELTATGCSFYGYDIPVFIESTNTGLVNLGDCVSRNTLGAKSVRNDSTAATEYDCGSRWDQTSDITPSV